MAAFVAGLLGMSQQELRFRVERANQLTAAPFLSLYHSVSPLLGLSVSSDDSLLVAAVDEALPLPTSSQPAQLLEDADGEQNHAVSDASALEPLSLNSDAKSQEGELQLTLCEQGLCGRGEALPQRGEQEGGTLTFCLEEGLAGQGEALPQIEEEGSQLVGHEVAELSLAMGAASVAQLDGGCLAKIMSRVDNSTLQACSLVCREWLEVSSFARTLMSLQEGPQITALPSLVTRFARLQNLHIQGPKIPPPRMLQQDSPAPGLLLTEQANIVPLDDSAMNIIAQGCRNLRKLQLEGCSGFSDVGLNAVLRGCSELVALRLGDCGGFTGEAFGGLKCRVEVLDLDLCVGLTNEGLLAAGKACPNLRDLSVQADLGNASLGQGLEGAARACPGLRALLLHGCGVGDETLQSVAASCPLLSTFSVSCEHAVTDSGLAAFFAALPALETVALHTMRGLSRVPKFGPSTRLKKLRIAYWWNATDLVLRDVSAETNLEVLLLVCCPHLTDATVDKIIAGCKSLKRLVLCDNDSITAESLRAYRRSGRKTRLEVRGCTGVTKESLPEDLKCEEVLQCLRS
ncbi:F-box/RNI-like superfamily protein [Klebsormidium nitens]|uniref:F-box/RNI-like superfamily protein n=1 Tax=Klebsormidium nitens TaxID=105231 RepID=A0A1Y1HZG6_KLENI|nr:F-box/RNI-like superfamily protein [Klebsormidium nitens]|eukprot:GAQ84070.1 F-box/RNI-like superfamily protein [Klebsormidium nitens]